MNNNWELLLQPQHTAALRSDWLKVSCICLRRVFVCTRRHVCACWRCWAQHMHEHMFTRGWLVCSWLIGSPTRIQQQHTHSSEVNPLPNPSFAHQAALLHLTFPSILHPVVTFKAYPKQSPERSSAFSVSWNSLEFPPKFWKLNSPSSIILPIAFLFSVFETKFLCRRN